MDNKTEKLPPEKQIVSILRAIPLAKASVASINGDIGQRIKDLQDSHDLNAKAIKEVARRIGMDEVKRNDYLRALKLYSDIAEKHGLFGEEHAADMVDDLGRPGETADGPDSPEPDYDAIADAMDASAKATTAEPKRRPGRPRKVASNGDVDEAPGFH